MLFVYTCIYTYVHYTIVREKVQGATEIKRHRRWDPNAAGRMPPHLGA